MRNFKDVNLVAAWDNNLERGLKATKRFELQISSSPDNLLENPSTDAVIIGTETNLHAEFIEMVSPAGKHILLQKPMATTLEDCDRIIHSINRSRVKFSMAF